MQPLKDYLKSQKDVIIDTLYIDMDLGSRDEAYDLIIEAKTFQVDNTNYWYRIDNPFGEPRPGNLKHMHGFIYKRKKLHDLFAVNSDGTAHDGWHHTKIPEEFISIMKDKGFKIPNNNIIEMVCIPACKNSLLVENFDVATIYNNKVLFKESEISEAINSLFKVIVESEEFVYGITNIPLLQIVHKRERDGYHRLMRVYISNSSKKASIILKLCDVIAHELSEKVNKHFVEVDPALKSTAFVVYVAYKCSDFC